MVVLERKGVNEQIGELIKDSYKGCCTRVKTKEDETGRIGLQKGIKQGDPLSPVLVNVATDPCLHTLERLGAGFMALSMSVTSLVFVDDLMLLSDSWDGMFRNLAILERFCNTTGLKVNPSKCHELVIGIKGK